MSDPTPLSIDIIFGKVCVLVTAAFALTLVPGFRQPERSLLSRRDQATVLLVFLVLGLVEGVTVSPAAWLNERIVAVCAAGLLAGPLVGLAVSVFVLFQWWSPMTACRCPSQHVVRWFGGRMAY
jgi:LytS/YehU family sensor histidine kinase